MEPFQPHARPDESIVRALEEALSAARRGHVKAVLIIAVNPLHKAENKMAGDLGDTNRMILVGSMSKVAHQLVAMD